MDIIAKILGYLGPVANAIKGHLNTGELLRIVVLSLLSGGGVLGVLVGVQGDLGAIVDPTYAGLAGLVLTFVIDAVRRLNHGDPAPAPAPAPAPKPAPGPVVNPDDGFPK